MKTKNKKVNSPNYFKHVTHMVDKGQESPLYRAQGGGNITNTDRKQVNCNKCLKVMKGGRK